MKRLFAVFFFFAVLLSVTVSAQHGDFYLKHFNVSLPHIDNENYAITHDAQGQMRVANRKGLLKFDGLEWKITNTPGTVLSAQFDVATNSTFIGCVNDFGYVTPNAVGKDQYVSLAPKESGVFEIAKIEITSDYVYFLGADVLYEYSKKGKKISRRWQNIVTNIFVYNQEVFACFSDNSIRRIGAAAMERYNFAGKPNADIIFCTPVNKNSSLVGTSENKIYVLSKDTFREIPLKDAKYIDKCELTDGLVVDGSTAVLATSKGGCLIADIRSGETMSVVNLYSGLPDDEIYAIGKDDAEGVWIAHEYGVTRLDYHVPLKCYSNYVGIEGKIEAASTYNNNVYVATNEGVFMLDEVKYFMQIKNKPVKKKLVSVVEKPTITEAASADKTEVAKEPEVTVKERFSLRNFFRKKSKKKEEQQNKEAIAATPETPAVIQEATVDAAKSTIGKAPAPKTKISANQSSTIESVKHVYRKVSGINAKCNQLICFKNKLLVATNAGIYVINGLTSTRICADNIKYLYVSKYDSRIYACTSAGDVIAYDYNGVSWIKLKLFDKVKQPVSYISEDNQKNLWLSGISKIYKVTVGNNQSKSNIEEISVNNPYSDDIYSVNINKQLYFTVSSTFYRYDYAHKQLVRDAAIEKQFKDSEKLVNSQSDILWFFNHKTWQYVSDIVVPNKNLIYLSILRDIDEIITDPNKDVYWVVTEDKKLYKFDLRKDCDIYTRPTVFVKDIQSVNGNNYALNHFVIQQDQSSSLMLNVVSPDYYDQEALEYQYKVEGAYNNGWSAWSKNNIITVNNLSPGDYIFRVKSRNSIGQEIEKEAVHFTVKPPYWQTWWFYLLEVLFFGCLWLLSVRLNRANHSNRVIRKMLTFLTLVMTVEFMSTVADHIVNVNISPVLDFLVRVVIAILLFPVEQFLERTIKNNKSASKTKKETVSA